MSKYIYETDNLRDFTLASNAGKLSYALTELSRIRRDIYKGYKQGVYVVDGKEYTDQEYFSLTKLEGQEIHKYYTPDQVLDMLDSVLDSINISLLDD